MRLSFVLVLWGSLLIACQPTISPVEHQKTPNIFFDIKSFFQKEIAHLEKIGSFKKTVSINGVLEEKLVKTLDFDKELSIFMDADINRPAWSDKYSIDSIFTPRGQLVQLRYLTLEESLKTKKIIIDFQQEAVSHIIIEKGLDNAVAQSKQTLNYTAGKEYSIQSEQALSFSETKTILVKVEYGD